MDNWLIGVATLEIDDLCNDPHGFRWGRPSAGHFPLWVPQHQHYVGALGAHTSATNLAKLAARVRKWCMLAHYLPSGNLT
jgi:hypothetical protein